MAEEGLQGIRVVKSFGRENYETQRYHNAMEKTFRASLRMSVYNSAFAALMMFLGFSTIAAIMWYGREVISGHLTLAMITGFLMYGISIAGSLGGLAGLYASSAERLAGYNAFLRFWIPIQLSRMTQRQPSCPSGTWPYPV